MRLAGFLLTIWACGMVISLPGEAICLQTEREQVGYIIKLRGPVYWKKDAKAKETLLDPARDGDGNRALYAGEMVRCGKGGFLLVVLNRVERKIEPSKDWLVITLVAQQDQSDDTRKAGRKAEVKPSPAPELPESRAEREKKSEAEYKAEHKAEAKPAAEPPGAKPVEGPGGRKGATAGATAASASSSMPTVREIFERYNRALFREYTARERESEVVKGTLELPMGVIGNLTIYTKGPDKAVAIVDVPGFGMIREGLNGRSAWAQYPVSGVRETPVSELLLAKFGPEFYRGGDLQQMYKKLELKGTQAVSDEMAYVVEATPFDGEPEKLYFDVSTGLLIRVDSMLSSGGRNIPFESYLEDYREVDGVKIPFTVRRINPVSSFIIKLSEVKHNVTVDDAKFNKP